MNIVFENSGEIDLRTVLTFGCSVKETKNPIGFFGTGLKYAIGVLLRTGHAITIQAGAQSVEVTARKDTIRGKEFEFVYVGETPAGFTTELGKNWEVWMAYRELHCNAKDEPDGRIFETDESLIARAGITRVVVSGEKIEAAHVKRREFILEGEPLFNIGSIEVHAGATDAFFYRGIKVMNFQSPALYTYNQTERVELTEDRTVKDPHSVNYALAREILHYGEAPFLERVLTADNKSVEFTLDFHGWGNIQSNDFYPTVAKLQKSSIIRINQTALRLWREKGNGFLDPRRVRATSVQVATLEKAIEFCERAGFMLRGEYPIFIVETLGENGCLAMADMMQNQIFLTERLFETGGTKGVASALIEEYSHLKFKLSDCSREMQNYYLGKVVSLAEQLTGEPI